VLPNYLSIISLDDAYTCKSPTITTSSTLCLIHSSILTHINLRILSFTACSVSQTHAFAVLLIGCITSRGLETPHSIQTSNHGGLGVGSNHDCSAALHREETWAETRYRRLSRLRCYGPNGVFFPFNDAADDEHRHKCGLRVEEVARKIPREDHAGESRQ
jgi:hypothetical protein